MTGALVQQFPVKCSIEDANKEYGTQLLISENTYDKVRQHVRVGRKCVNAALGEKGSRYTLYEIVGIRTTTGEPSTKAITNS